MRKPITLVIAAALLVPSIARAQADTTVRRIVNEYIAARGGLARIKAVRNIVFRAKGADGDESFMARARPFFYLVGEPTPTRDFAEGTDGAPWEFYGGVGLVLRTAGAPAAAARHTGYFDDELVRSLEPGTKLILVGVESIAGHPAYALRATGADGFQSDLFVDKVTHLLVAIRKTAPYHAFGPTLKTETRVGGWRNLGGALFATSFNEFVIATGKPLTDLSITWTSVDYNVELPLDYFSPPPIQNTPLARMLNSAYAARAIPTDALGWYTDFRQNPKTATIDTREGMEAVGYQCAKNGAPETAILLLQANLKDYPGSASSHFGLGRAYRAAGMEAGAKAQFRAALAIDPGYKRASDALEAPVVPTAASH